MQLRVAESLPAVLRHQISRQISHQISHQISRQILRKISRKISRQIETCPTNATDSAPPQAVGGGGRGAIWAAEMAIWEVEIADLEEEVDAEDEGSGSAGPASLYFLAPPPSTR